MRATATLGMIAMSLLGCLTGRSPSLKPAETLPEGAGFVVYDDGKGLVAVDTSTKTAYRWSPRGGTAADLAKVPHVQLGNTLLARGGLALPLAVPAGGRDVSVSPDLSRFAYTKPGEGAASSVEIMNLDGSGAATLAAAGSAPTWLPDGALSYRGGDQMGGPELFRVSPDGSALETLVDTRGPAISYVEWSPDGQRVAFSLRTPDGRTRVDVVKADGSEGGPVINVEGAEAIRPRWSPDGQWLAAMVRLPASVELVAPHTLWVVDMSTGQGRAILDLPAKEPSLLPRGGYKGVREIAWSPDSRSVAFFGAMSGDCNQNTSGELLCRHDVYVVNRDGTGLEDVLKARADQPRALVWLP